MSEQNYHPTTAIIRGLLEKNGFWYQAFEHEPVKTSEEAAKVRLGYTLHQGAKAIIARIKVPNQPNKFAMFVIPGDARLDIDKIKIIYSAKDLRFATLEEVSAITNGIESGGVPPFGNIFNLEVVVDPTLLANEKIIFNAGDRSYSIGMYSKDYVTLVDPKILNIT